MKKLLFLIISFSQLFCSFSQNGDVGSNKNWESPIINYTDIFVKKNDTIFCYEVYKEDDEIDSVIVSDLYLQKDDNKKWVSKIYSDSSYAIAKFKKIKPSKLFNELNHKYFNAEFELKRKKFDVYYPDGRIFKYRYFYSFIYKKKHIQRIKKNK